MTKIKETFLVLAISATKLYQFVGKDSLESTLQNYQKDHKLIQNHAVVISGKQPTKSKDSKFDYRTSSDSS